ncbi:MAG: MFS transporter [Oscillospiraceae bacterium]|nr:MFS transporter [Oscillospiraceae bacterium]MBQ5343321.1 MFS transporter [Oscillospiraceae bacterium]
MASKVYLQGGLFDRDSMQTRIKTNRISAIERVLGYIIGPGFVYLQNSTTNSLRELFFMDVIRINEVYGSPYTYMILTIVTTAIGLLFGFYLNHLTENTVSRAGRFRPWVLIGNVLMAVSGFLMFWSPFEFGTTAHLVWLYVASILYTSISIPMYGLSTFVTSTCSRNVLERNSLTTLSSSVRVMIAGTFGAMVITGIIYPSILQHDLTGKSWTAVIGVCSVLCIIAAFVEYFYTRERVTEENMKVLEDQSGQDVVTIPLKEQFRLLLHNKYFILAMVVLIGSTFYDALQGGNARVNMITYILGGNEQNGFQMLYLLASMQPMAIGAVVVPIIARKVSSRKILIISSIITLVGVGISMVNPYSFVVAVAGGFVFACGIFAVTNMYEVFRQQAYDHIEYEHGYRAEGTLATGIITTVISTLMMPMNAVYETGLTLSGYQAGLAVQPDAVNKWILFAYYGAYAIFAIIVLVVSILFDLEPKMPMIHEELRERAKKAAEDRGEVYISPEEQDRLELEEAARELEESRVAELRALCEKKGLDFETENNKYLEKEAAKRAKAEAKAARKNRKK